MSDRHDGQFSDLETWAAHVQAEHRPLEEWAAEDLRAELELVKDLPERVE